MSLTRKQFYKVIMAIMISMIAACSSTVVRVSDPSKIQEFSFLQPGITSNEEIETRLGLPLNEYENGRVATYAFNRINGKYNKVAAFSSQCFDQTCYHLILIYREDGVLDKWSMVFDRYSFMPGPEE